MSLEPFSTQGRTYIGIVSGFCRVNALADLEGMQNINCVYFLVNCAVVTVEPSVPCPLTLQGGARVMVGSLGEEGEAWGSDTWWS